MSPQQTIAHYRIVAKLGEGGMGAVYRATDTKLNRDVAIKVLPDSFANDPDRLTRFTREAQLLAQLNHPNIAAIYGVEDRALILELVEGDTLADRIAAGALPIDEALPLARQIAEALEYAHEKNIIHRDLKPANIKLTAQGNAKVLDFGLAKALSSEAPPAASPASSPTLTLNATQLGVIMGTAGYMSPEQARGKPADRRADIWAFGVVLYEMLSGRALYRGETVPETLASVLKDQPTLDALPPEVPPHIRRLLVRCLEKDPRKRLQAIGEARIALEEAPGPAPAPAVAGPGRAGTHAWRWAAAGLAAGLALAAAALIWPAPRSAPGPVYRFSVDMGPEASADESRTAAISPDGSRVVYTAVVNGANLLGTRRLDETRTTILPGTENARWPFFSPDSQWVGFSSLGQLWKVSVQGGSRLAMGGTGTRLQRGASWSADGNLYTSDGTQLIAIPASGGTPRTLTHPEAGVLHRGAFASPGASGILFTLFFTNATGPDSFKNAEIDSLNLKSGEVRKLLQGGYSPQYIPTGHLIYQHDNTLFAVRYDARQSLVEGTPVAVLDDVEDSHSLVTGPSRQFDVSQNGVLVYLSGKSSRPEPLMWLDASGSRALVAAPSQRVVTPRISPDGKRVAFSLGGDLVVYDVDRGSSTRLTVNADAAYPVWTPDGKAIAFSWATGTGWVPSDGSAPPQVLLPSAGFSSPVPQSFSPDGHRLAFHQGLGRIDHRAVFTVALQDTGTGAPKAGEPEKFVETERSAADPMYSPDGRWIAYIAGTLGAYQVFVRPAPGADGGGQVLVSTDAGRFPMWSRTSKELFYVNNAGIILAVPYTVNGSSFVPGKPHPWSQQGIQLNGVNYPIDIAPNGKSFVATLAPGVSGGKSNLHLVFVLNFFDVVKRLAP